MNKYDLLLKMYVGTDDLRPAMKQVNNNNGMLEATDGHILIRLPEKYANGKYGPVEKYPNILSVMYNKFEGGTHKITTNHLAGVLAQAEARYQLESHTCDNCAGSGETECNHCGNEATCDICDGTGIEESDYPFAKIEYSGENLIINERGFSPKYLHILYITALIMGVDEIILKFTDQTLNKGVTISLNDVEILLMPVMLNRQ